MEEKLHLMTFYPTRGNIQDDLKVKLKGVLLAMCRDTSRRNLCVAHVEDGTIYCTNGHKIHWAEMEGLPENGEYDVYILSKSRALFIKNENCGTYPNVKNVIKPMAHSESILGIAGISAIGIHSKTLINHHLVLETFNVLNKEGRAILSWGNPNNEQDVHYPIMLDNGLWKALVMPVRDWNPIK